MVKIIGHSLTFLLPLVAIAQPARMVINDNAYLTMNGGTVGTPIYVVVENPAANAITIAGAGANIVSEGEYNKIRWNIGTTVGTYTVPFYSHYNAAGQKIPYTMQVTGAGVGATGRVDFSTYRTAAANNLPWASLVTHMFDAATATVDHSNYVVDRWWVIDANNYGTRPNVNMSITYNNTEFPAPNALMEANLVAQRWNSNENAWSGSHSLSSLFFGAGTLNMATRTLGPFAVPNTEFFKNWVLVDRFFILPVELLSFTADCENGSPKLLWSTATETDSRDFTIARSPDGHFYQTVGNVEAAGYSTQITQYEFIDFYAPSGKNFYQLVQSDNNGVKREFGPVISDCGVVNGNGFSASYSQIGRELLVTFNLSNSDNQFLEVFDDNGRRIYAGNIAAQEGSTLWQIPLYQLSTGMYFVTATSDAQRFSQKIFVAQ